MLMLMLMLMLCGCAWFTDMWRILYMCAAAVMAVGMWER